jgi:hypothetical protein
LEVPNEFRQAYPATELAETEFYVVDRLVVHEQSANAQASYELGGLTSSGRVFVQIPNAGNPYPRRYVLGQLHSEFSSVLVGRHTFPWAEWRRCGGGYRYSNSDPFELAGSKSGWLSFRAKSAHRSGLLTRYSAVSALQDLNMYVLYSFWNPELLLQLEGTAPRVACKMELMEQFYREIGASWTVRGNRNSE